MLSHTSQPCTFERDCDVVMIPSGDAVTIPAGTSAYITQALGGSFTVFVDGNLFRVSGMDADAIGREPILPPSLPENASNDDVEKLLWDQLKTCYDPEIPVNIVELGLIYDLKIQPLPEGGSRVEVKMTLTAPGCGMGEFISQDARDRIVSVPGVKEADVQVVFDPPWNQQMMSEAAKLELGLL